MFTNQPHRWHSVNMCKCFAFSNSNNSSWSNPKLDGKTKNILQILRKSIECYKSNDIQMILVQKSTLPSLKLRFPPPQNMVVSKFGISKLPAGPYFQGRAVSFREGTCEFLLVVSLYAYKNKPLSIRRLFHCKKPWTFVKVHRDSLCLPTIKSIKTPTCPQI